MLKMMLQAHLITFNVSFSYQDALTHIKERKKNKTCCPNFKVILIDLDSGGLDGLEMAIGIFEFYNAKQEQYPNVVGTSTLVSDELKRKCLRIGFSDFLEKPYNQKKLLDCLLQFLN